MYLTHETPVATVLAGVLETGGKGDDVHVAQACWYAIDFSPLNEAGVYTLELAGTDTQHIIIDDDPYGKFAAQALHHLSTMRSGILFLLYSMPIMV